MAGFFITLFYKLIWWIFIEGPLIVISTMSEIINYLGGTLVLKLLFGINQDFSFSGIPPAFWGMVGVGVLIALILFITSIIVSFHSGKDEELKLKIINGLKFAFIGLTLIFLIPMMILVFGLFLNAIGLSIPSLFNNQSSNLADLLYYIGSPDGIGPPRNGDMSTPSNIGSYNIIVESIGVWFVMISFALVAIQLVVKTIEIFILFIFSPIIAFSSVTDNGGRIVILKNMIFSKYVVVLIDIIGFTLSIYAINQVYQITNNIDNSSVDFWGKTILELFVVCGGASTMLSVSNLAGGFVGQESGLKENLSNIKSTLFGAGAIAFGGAGWAANFAVKLGGMGKNFAAGATGETASKTLSSKFGRAFGKLQIQLQVNLVVQKIPMKCTILKLSRLNKKQKGLVMKSNKLLFSIN